ncbi:MAG TPA: hypothetical protein VF881_18685, partial [Polyangiaceae bacterium]
MEKAPTIRPYPWGALETLPRETIGLLRDTRRAVARAIDERKIEQTLSEALGQRVRVLVSVVKVAVEEPSSFHAASVALATTDDALRIQLEVDRELARTLVARIMGRPPRIGDPRAPLAPEVEGALLAIVTSVARRAHGSGAVLVPMGSGAWRREPGERHLEVHATVMVGDDAYAARASIQLRKAFSPGPIGAAELASLGP